MLSVGGHGDVVALVSTFAIKTKTIKSQIAGEHKKEAREAILTSYQNVIGVARISVF